MTSSYTIHSIDIERDTWNNLKPVDCIIHDKETGVLRITGRLNADTNTFHMDSDSETACDNAGVDTGEILTLIELHFQ